MLDRSSLSSEGERTAKRKDFPAPPILSLSLVYTEQLSIFAWFVFMHKDPPEWTTVTNKLKCRILLLTSVTIESLYACSIDVVIKQTLSTNGFSRLILYNTSRRIPVSLQLRRHANRILVWTGSPMYYVNSDSARPTRFFNIEISAVFRQSRSNELFSFAWLIRTIVLAARST